MLSHNNPESTSAHNTSPLTLVWYKDGIGIDNGTNTYNIRASNILLNMQRIAGLTAGTLAFVGSSLSQVSGFQDKQAFRVKDTNDQFIAWDWNFHGNHLGDVLLQKLRDGACHVVPIDQHTSYVDPDCVDMRTADPYWLFATNPLEGTTCESLYKVSRCIADMALSMGQSSTVFPPSDPNITTPSPPPLDSSDDHSLTPMTIALITGASVCALGTLAFFGRKIYKKCTANSGYAPVAIYPPSPLNHTTSQPKQPSKSSKPSQPFNQDCDDAQNYNCPIHLGLMKDPYELNCGHNFDLESVQAAKLNDTGNCNCPVCRAPITQIKPNLKLKAAIENYKVVIDVPDETLMQDENPNSRMKMTA